MLIVLGNSWCTWNTWCAWNYWYQGKGLVTNRLLYITLQKIYFITFVFQGAKGYYGTPGKEGVQGPRGRTGPQGPVGDRGRPGAPVSIDLTNINSFLSKLIQSNYMFLVDGFF